MSNEIEVQKYKKIKEPDGYRYVRVFDYNATFCEWGCNYEEFDAGAGNFSTAIVKKEDGQIESVLAQLVRFKSKDELDKESGE
jgi:hypothetical protein